MTMIKIFALFTMQLIFLLTKNEPVSAVERNVFTKGLVLHKGLYNKKHEACRIPDFVKSNTDFYDVKSEKINQKNINKLWKMVKFQMVLKHGKELVTPPADVNVFDRMYFELKYYITCSNSKLRFN